METERPWQSRTMWKAFITTAVGLIALFGVDLPITAEQEVALLGGIMSIVGFLAAYLRVNSPKVIAWKEPEDEPPTGI